MGSPTISNSLWSISWCYLENISIWYSYDIKVGRVIVFIWPRCNLHCPCHTLSMPFTTWTIVISWRIIVTLTVLMTVSNYQSMRPQGRSDQCSNNGHETTSVVESWGQSHVAYWRPNQCDATPMVATDCQWGSETAFRVRSAQHLFADISTWTVSY